MTMMKNDEEIYKERDPDTSEPVFYLLFASQLIIVLMGMFMSVKTGLITLPIVTVLGVIALGRCSSRSTDWKRGRNLMAGLILLWGLYCLFEIGNPNHVQEAWNIAITQYFFYPLLCAFLVPLTIRNYKGIEVLLLIWSVFVLIATLKGYWQKNHGFNERELYFLYVLGGYRTHIIWSGIRYFSCFSDAANYGVHAAMAATTFGLSAFFVRKKWMKIYFGVITLCALYCIGISGTRAAVGVPLGGILLYVLISKNWKGFVLGIVSLFAVFSFFYFTNIGDSNQYVRKMRSAFRPNKDASYQVRVENKNNMKALMAVRPIGYGLGLSKGARFQPRELMHYPPDSWLVSVWVETGIIGLVLYLLVHGVLFAWCSWLLMFKVMNKRLRGLLAAWLCMAAGFFVAAYVNDVMQYPNSIIVYTGFALCIAGPYIDPVMQKEEEEMKKKKNKTEQEEFY